MPNINMLVDEEKNIVIFPISRSEEVFEDNPEQHKYYVAYYPIELKYPYTVEELAEKIKCGFDEWDKHECYPNFSGRNTFEEKYYGIKGFKNAVKGKKRIFLSRDGNCIDLYIPLKRGYAYIFITGVKISADKNFENCAKAVIELVNEDITGLKTYKTYKSKLNI